MAGCSGLAPTAGTSTSNGSALHGSVYGGQQPISGANIYLYAAGTSGYGAANTNLLNTAVQTDASGMFNFTGDYTCTAGQQMYIVSVGGNPGAGTNANATLMAALGDCANLGSTTFINMNEVTTVGSVFALAPFMTSYSGIGTSAANNAGLVQAFASVKKLTNFSTGAAGAVAGATVPVAEIYSLANVLSSCINSTGGVAGDNSSCGTLFSLATPSGGTAPTETVGAALLIAQNPANNAGPIFGRMPAQSPFAPVLTSAPADWTMSIHYTSVGLNLPKSTTVDANGNVWFANSGNNTVAVLAQTGVPISGSPFSGNGLNAPAAIAMDASGNAWVANMGALSLSAFTSTGGVYGSSPYTPAGLSAPDALAFDASGDLWVANSGNSSVSELSNSGASLQQISSGVSAPGAIAIDPK